MNKIKKFLDANLRGVGQIMLQNNAWTGALFLLGILVNSWVMFVGAVLGVLSGTVVAMIAKFKDEDIRAGLYGFNGTLVGLALTFFYEFNLTNALLIILFSIISTFVMHFMYTKKLSPFTFPFVLTTWIAIFAINSFGLLSKVASDALAQKLDILSGISMGFGQVMFQGSIITGVVFLIGLLVSSRRSAWFGLIGSVVGMLVALLLGKPYELITIGIFGYNAVLCGIAFSDDKKFAYISALIAIISSVLILDGFMTLNLVALTTPFVFATWVTMFLRNKIVK